MIKPSVIPVWVKAVAIVLALAALGGVLWGGHAAYNTQLTTRYNAGYAAGKAEFERLHAQASTSAREQQIKQAETDRATAAAAGASHEQRRTAVDARFDQLNNQLATAHAKGTRHERSSNADRCTVDDADLPAERLRIWRAANSGGADRAAAAESAPASQSAGSSPSTATAGGWRNQDAGTQPPGSDAVLPPAGDADVRPAEVPHRGSSRLQRLADPDLYWGN